MSIIKSGHRYINDAIGGGWGSGKTYAVTASANSGKTRTLLNFLRMCGELNFIPEDAGKRPVAYFGSLELTAEACTLALARLCWDTVNDTDFDGLLLSPQEGLDYVTTYFSDKGWDIIIDFLPINSTATTIDAHITGLNTATQAVKFVALDMVDSAAVPIEGQTAADALLTLVDEIAINGADKDYPILISYNSSVTEPGTAHVKVHNSLECEIVVHLQLKEEVSWLSYTIEGQKIPYYKFPTTKWVKDDTGNIDSAIYD